MDLSIRKQLSILIVCLIFLSGFTAYKKEHHCTGANCLVCTVLKKRVDYKKQLQQSAGPLLRICNIAVICIFLPLDRTIKRLFTSLISAKVRLDL